MSTSSPICCKRITRRRPSRIRFAPTLRRCAARRSRFVFRNPRTTPLSEVFMSRPDRSGAPAIVLAGLSFASFATIGSAQANMAPINSAPNPYTTVVDWAKMPEGRTWGSTSAVDIDRDGKSIWVAERCGTNNCATSTLDPVLKFDSNGKLVAHFGAGMILSPHAITVDKDNNIWDVDCACTLGGGGRGRGGAGRGTDSAGAGRAATPPAAPAPDVTGKGHQI